MSGEDKVRETRNKDRVHVHDQLTHALSDLLETRPPAPLPTDSVVPEDLRACDDEGAIF